MSSGRLSKRGGQPPSLSSGIWTHTRGERRLINDSDVAGCGEETVPEAGVPPGIRDQGAWGARGGWAVYGGRAKACTGRVHRAAPRRSVALRRRGTRDGSATGQRGHGSRQLGIVAGIDYKDGGRQRHPESRLCCPAAQCSDADGVAFGGFSRLVGRLGLGGGPGSVAKASRRRGTSGAGRVGTTHPMIAASLIEKPHQHAAAMILPAEEHG